MPRSRSRAAMSRSAPADAGVWFVCQIGARENYAIARALHRHGALGALVTDAWVPPVPGLRLFAPKLAARYHRDLSTARIEAPTVEAIAREGWDAARRAQGFDRILRRNAWFQRKAVSALAGLAPEAGSRTTVFSYSYAAREIFRFAKGRGWRTVLGQIDPGPVEDRLVKRLHAEQGEATHAGKPDSYWDSWREETSLADVIVANSEWSREALEQEGIAPAKVRVVPLAYEPSAEAIAHRIQLPDRFSEARPMRVLFLGQVILRKGVVPLLEAIERMRDAPVEFHLVGARAVAIPPGLAGSRKVFWHGQVARSEIDRFYRTADVFVFPTLSDGFGLTQLEALAWGVPVIASKHCGAAVVSEVNGLTLPEVTSARIEEALRRLLVDPGLIAGLSAGARGVKISGLDDLFFKIAG